ncbi:hypothetical protein Taro_011602 [Colocasia esculenta]|uniref:Uncharacterized protein n=1 Tax=Colocasia esculenta TaxID=4460 RepID=A0A843UB48_COLES|nr:hypothetical protein [Colocasia esculenta]
MWEAWDKAMKTTGNRDPMAWLDYGPVWLRRDYWETYDRKMAERYAEGTPQPDLDLEAWVDAAGGPRKGRVYGFGDSMDTTPVLS